MRGEAGPESAKGMLQSHRTGAHSSETARVRLRVALVTLLLLGIEQTIFALQLDTLAGVRWAYEPRMVFMRYAALIASSALFYWLLEAANRFRFAAAVVLLCAGFLPIGVLQQFLFRFGLTLVGEEVGPPSTLVRAAEYWIQFYLVWGAGVLAYFYTSSLKREQELRLAAADSAHRSRMRSMRYGLNEHFLFNTLNSIGLLALEGEKAKGLTLIQKLSSFLRTTLQSDGGGYHPLTAEFDRLRDYLEIEHNRFPDRLAYGFDLPAELSHAAVPPFVLQPFVEEVIRDEVSNRSTLTSIAIAAGRVRDDLRLTIAYEGAVQPIGASDGPPIQTQTADIRTERRDGVAVERTAGERGGRIALTLPYLALASSAQNSGEGSL